MSKLKSRKFWVWIIGNIFVITAIYLTKTVTPEIVSFMTFNQLFYVGGNSFSKYIYYKKGE